MTAGDRIEYVKAMKTDNHTSKSKSGQAHNEYQSRSHISDIIYDYATSDTKDYSSNSDKSSSHSQSHHYAYNRGDATTHIEPLIPLYTYR